MRLSEYIKTSKVSGQELAGLLGVSQPVVSSWVIGRKPVPEKRCVEIERITGGAVTRRDLRPNDWAAIWPELSVIPAHSPAAPVTGLDIADDSQPVLVLGRG